VLAVLLLYINCKHSAAKSIALVHFLVNHFSGGNKVRKALKILQKIHLPIDFSVQRNS